MGRERTSELTKKNENNYEAKNDKIKSLYVRPYIFRFIINDAEAEISRRLRTQYSHVSSFKYMSIYTHMY